jgi:ABC-2 type transport system ATP-binding protein
VPSSPPLPAVRVDAVSKDFALPHEHVHTLKERVLHPLRGRSHETLHALRDVSFDVAPGEFFGIVGRNGSGKSTLLKCMAGIYATDRGAIYINGRLSTFIELGVGFNPDLPARDNAMLNATLLGLSPREAARRFDEVIAFAELEEFVDLKLKNYSSGMEVRLAFSVMIQVDADILLIDEVLAVGDAAFAQKCFEEFERIKRSGTTVVLVTHDMGSVDRFCDRAMLLEHGAVAELGVPHHVGLRYLQLNFSPEAREAEADAAGTDEQVRLGDGSAEITGAWFEDEHGARAEYLESGRRATAALRVRFAADVDDPTFAIALINTQNRTVVGATTQHTDPTPGRFPAGEEVTLRFTFDNVLGPDRYTLSASVARAGSGMDFCDHREEAATVVVGATTSSGGLVELPVEIALQRGAGTREEASA